jgi:hypothetical protein
VLKDIEANLIGRTVMLELKVEIPSEIDIVAKVFTLVEPIPRLSTFTVSSLEKYIELGKLITGLEEVAERNAPPGFGLYG